MLANGVDLQEEVTVVMVARVKVKLLLGRVMGHTSIPSPLARMEAMFSFPTWEEKEEVDFCSMSATH